MASGNLVIIGLLFEIFGALIAILNKIPKLNNVLDRIWPFKQINKGLEKLDPLDYDIPFENRTLKSTDEGFKEILFILNARFGPFEQEFDAMYFQHIPVGMSKGTSMGFLALVNFDNGKKYEIYPTTRRDLLVRIDFWKERHLVVIGFICFVLGAFFQFMSLF